MTGERAPGTGAGGAPPEPRVATEADVLVRAHVERNRSMIEHGRRMGGLPGAMVAGALIALRDIYEPPRDGEIVASVESPSDPIDIDVDGIRLSADGIDGPVDVMAPPLAPRPPIANRRSPRRRSRRRV